MSLSKSKCWYSNNCLHFLSAHLWNTCQSGQVSQTFIIKWTSHQLSLLTDLSFLNNYNFTFYYSINWTSNHKFSLVSKHHRHLSIIDCLKAHTSCLVCFISTVNGHHKKKPRKTGASSGNIKNLKQSILETFDIFTKHLQRHEKYIYLCLTKSSSFLQVIFQK